MSWLLFMDESGHDHKNTPMEVRGGVALHAGAVWSFIQGWQRLELECFGTQLRHFGLEAKGEKLLGKRKFKWQDQQARIENDERRKLARAFFAKSKTGVEPSRDEYTAYGQACIEMARGVFDLMSGHNGKIFAAAIPRGVKKPDNFQFEDYLRKDHVFLLERYFYFLEQQKQHGLIVMDESEKTLDRDFVRRLEAYFSKSAVGRNRAHWIVPVPFFVSSDMTFAVQAADICMYVINWGYRLPAWQGIDEARPEIRDEFEPKLRHLQWTGDGYRDGQTFRSSGIVLVQEPFSSKAQK